MEYVLFSLVGASGSEVSVAGSGLVVQVVKFEAAADG